MNPADFQRLADRFDEATEGGAVGERTPPVQDPLVRSLLEFDRRPPAFLEEEKVSSLALIREWLRTSESHDDDAPAVEGFEVLGVLGVGGTGTVYRARQERPVREVAIKVMRSGPATGSMRRRFEFEAEILARLQHPAIAQVFSAGMAGEGPSAVPFLVMELVEGRPLLEVALEPGVSRTDRLKLFLHVCEGVAYAHQQGVIHRDLKSGNILVTSQRAVKILDFGIARLTGLDTGSLPATTAGVLLGTITHMSPEQLSGDPRAIDARCDIYALGVLLFELLTGTSPFDLTGLSFPEAAQRVAAAEPRPLASIDRSLRGDLDAIVHKAMARETSARYQSATELASDVGRYLRREPVTARRAGATYYVRRFAQRHRAIAAGSGIALLALIVGTVISARFGVQASRHAEKSRADAARAGALNRFLLDVFRAADAQSSTLGLERPSDVRVADVLRYGSERLARELGDQPQTEAEVRSVLGECFASLGLKSEAAREFERCLELCAASHGPDDPRTLSAELRLAQERLGLGYHTDGEQVARRIIPIVDAQLGPKHPDAVRSRHLLASSLYYLDRKTEALDAARDAYELAVRCLPPSDPARLDISASYARIMTDLGRAPEAIPVLEAVAVARAQTEGDAHPRTLLTRGNLVAALRAAGKLDEAIRQQSDIIDIQRRVLGDDHNSTLWSMGNLAVMLAQVNRRAEGIEVLRECLARARPENRDLPTFNLNLARMLVDSGLNSDAEPHARSALAAYGAMPEPPAHLLAISTSLVARACAASNRHQEAVEQFRSAIVHGTRAWHASAPRVLEFRYELARSLAALGRTAEAERELLECFELRESLPRGVAHAVPIALEELYKAMGNDAAAAKWSEITATESAVGPSPHNR